jgi:4-aminobutyrate aminotransferase
MADREKMGQQPGQPLVDLSEGDANLSSQRQAWDNTLCDETRRWLQRDSDVFLHQSLSTPCLNVLATCEDSGMTDLSGKHLLDFHGNSLHQAGYANPAVLAAVQEQLGTLSFCPRRYTNPPAVRLAEKLVEIAPGDLSRVLFAPGGTSAVGMALKLARIATGRFKTISMWDAFHGASLDAISVGGEALFRRDIGPLLPGTEHVPPADPHHCLWDPKGHCEDCGLKCAKYIEYVMEKEGDVAAVIAEPIRCTRVNPPPKGYWQAVRDACDRHGALLIFDETAVCLGRTGRMFACEHEEVVPDILTLGKGLGGGIFPLAAIVARESLNVGQEIALGHYTHEKNPVACAAGLAAIAYIEEHRLVERSDSLGRLAIGRLRNRLAGHPLVADIRGRGLLFGIELRQNGQPAAKEAEQVMYECLKNGLSFKISGGNFLTLTPALTITEEDLSHALDIIESAIKTVDESS